MRKTKRMQHHKMTAADYKRIALEDQRKYGKPKSYVMHFGIPVYEDDPVSAAIAFREAVASLSAAVGGQVIPAMEGLARAMQSASTQMGKILLASGLAHEYNNGREGGQ